MEKKFPNAESNYRFIENEKEILKLWEDGEFFKKLQQKNAGGKKYRFIDGPITANNPMGVHHAWGRTLKDVFLRYKGMNGYTSHYRNGFDGQGLWVEVEVEKELGFKTKKDIEAYGLDKFSDKCIERVVKYSGVIAEQSKRLGQWMDWDNSYYTYKDENITSIWAMLKKCRENGWIKEIYRPLPWCTRCGTSLSEHEMTGSYKEVEHEAVFFKLPVPELNSRILVWTTTPWTLSSNVALAVNPDLEYVMAKVEGEELPLIMSRGFFRTKFEGKGGEVVDSFPGTRLENLPYETCFPFMEKQKEVDHRIVLWEDVLDDEGSGIVHIAPGCGAEDFDLGNRVGLPIIMPIDEYGIFGEGFDFLSGKPAAEVAPLVFERLKADGKLFYTHKYKHSYPLCWRCKDQLLFRLVKAWAIDVEALRPKLIENAQKVQWYPAHEGKRMQDWLENMGDWNISRKRFYGLPLPFYPCEHCGELTVCGSREELRELAVDPAKVDALPHLHRPWIDEVEVRCPKCGKPVHRVPEVGDVWLDAGIVPFSTLKYFTDRDYWQEYFPAEYVIEMREQIRLWFYSLLFMSTVLVGEPPYEKVGTHGMVTAEDGSRFSKTGFMIKFDEAADKIGADASRYIFASSSPANDVRFGFKLGEEARRKLLAFWNLSSFFCTYAEIDRPEIAQPTDLSTLDVTDRFLLARVDSFITAATKAMEEYSVKDLISEFEKIVDDASNFYIRVNRRRFWKDGDTADKQNAYFCLYTAIKAITKVMAPVTPFITEYVWQNVILPCEPGEAESVHLSDWATPLNLIADEEIFSTVAAARNIISLGLKLRNEKQIKVRQPLSAVTVLRTADTEKAAAALERVILSELNILKLELADSMDSLNDNFATVNFKKAGALLKGDVNKVKDLVNALSDEDSSALAAAILAGGDVTVPGYDNPVSAEAFAVVQKPKAGVELCSEGELTLALHTTITPELKVDGLIRELVRQCQVCRKKAGFAVTDRIALSVETDDAEVAAAVTARAAFLESELLAKLAEVDAPEYTEALSDPAATVKMARI